MLGIAVTALMIWLGTQVYNLSVQYDRLAEMYRTRVQQQEVVNIAESLEQYYQENASFPASLNALASTNGYEYIRSSMNASQGYAVSPSINDSVWRFNRAVFFYADRRFVGTDSDYLADNKCGTGDFDTAESWCGNKQSMWFRKESRERFNEQIVTQRARLNRLSGKFSTYYSGNGSYVYGFTQTYPKTDASNAPLAANSVYALATLAGYGGTATNCTGNFQYKGIPIDCEDMFDIWGGRIGYQFINDDHIILISESPIFNASGNRVVIASDRT